MIELLLPCVLLGAGAAGLVWGGDRLVSHAVRLGRAARISPTVVGAVLLGFGTSLPELFVSAAAMFAGTPAIALGNVVGSNIANVGLILGIAALLAPVATSPRLLRLDLPLAVAAGPLLMGVGWLQGAVALPSALVLLGGFAFCVARSFRDAPTTDAAGDPAAVRPGWRVLAMDGLWLTASLVAVILGAHLFVRGAIGVANLLRVPAAVIGLTLVAVGTSLPELVTTLAAARRGQADLAFGTVLGSNVFNALFILGSVGAIAPVPIATRTLTVHLPVMTGFALLAYPWSRRRIGRWQGAVLLCAYCGYVLFLFLRGEVAVSGA